MTFRRTNPKRINVVGTSGSGKSTFARKLAQTMQLPYIEMDKVFWKPNWVEPSNEEFFLSSVSAVVTGGKGFASLRIKARRDRRRRLLAKLEPFS